MPDPGVLVLVAAAVFTGAFINALSGFGFGLISVPLMTLAVGPKDAVVLSAIIGLTSNSTVLWRNRTRVDRPVAGRVLLGALVGMPVGVVVLSRVADRPLEVLIASAVLVTVAVLASGARVVDPPPPAEVLTGFISGTLSTSIGIGGPPVVVLLTGRGMPKAVFRATAVAVFAVSGAVAVCLFGIAGRYDRSVLTAALVALPAMPLGFLVGDRVHDRVPEGRFRSVVLVLLVFTALVTLRNALAG